MGQNNIDPAKQWANKQFDDAVVAAGVGWMVVQWDLQYEPSVRVNCKACHDYTMFPNQFNDMPKDMPYEEVKAIFDMHVANRIEHNAKVHRDTDPVRITLFLLKVERCVNITDDNGKLLKPIQEIING
jgi:hypothetical protein